MQADQLPDKLAKLCEHLLIEPDAVEEVLVQPSKPGEPFIVRLTDSDDSLPYATIGDDYAEHESYQAALEASLKAALETRVLELAPATRGKGDPKNPTILIRMKPEEAVVFAAPSALVREHRWAELIRDKLPQLLLFPAKVTKVFCQDKGQNKVYGLQPLGDGGRPLTLPDGLKLAARTDDFVFLAVQDPRLESEDETIRNDARANAAKLIKAALRGAVARGEIRQDEEFEVVQLDRRVAVYKLVQE